MGNEQFTIMVVDDEEVVRELLGEVLEMLQYNVIIADSPGDGIDIFKENKERIDLVLLDMLMPEISGAELFTHIRKIKAEQKVIILSGYSNEAEIKQLMEEGVVGFIQKPVTIGELKKIIEQNIKK